MSNFEQKSAGFLLDEQIIDFVTSMGNPFSVTIFNQPDDFFSFCYKLNINRIGWVSKIKHPTKIPLGSLIYNYVITDCSGKIIYKKPVLFVSSKPKYS